MSFTAPRFTDEGKALQAKAQAGTALKFTKMQLGDGELGSQAIAAMTKLINPLITLDISSIKAGNNYAAIKSNFSNSGLSTGFYWREIGVFAADPEKPNDRNSDILYCYANAGSLAEYIPAAGSEIIEKVISVPCIIGDAENVSASVKSEIYVSKEDLNEHINDKNNPHEVTAEQIGALTDTTLTKTTILNKIGILDIEHGGTGAKTSSEACKNLGALPLSGGTMRGDIITNGHKILHNSSAQTCIILWGNDTYGLEDINNIDFSSWYGISFSPTVTSDLGNGCEKGKPSVSINVRRGHIYLKGDIINESGENYVLAALKGGKASVVKSVQRGTVNLSDVSTSTTSVTISSINMNKSFLLIDGQNYTAGNAGSFNASGKIKSSTILEFTPTYGRDKKYDYAINWQVVEYY